MIPTGVVRDLMARGTTGLDNAASRNSRSVCLQIAESLFPEWGFFFFYPGQFKNRASCFFWLQRVHNHSLWCVCTQPSTVPFPRNLWPDRPSTPLFPFFHFLDLELFLPAMVFFVGYTRFQGAARSTRLCPPPRIPLLVRNKRPPLRPVARSGQNAQPMRFLQIEGHSKLCLRHYDGET